MINNTLFWQLFRFGVIGCTAALVNFIGVVLLVEYLHWQPLVANILAFLIAFNVSYLGHRFWTFSHKQHASNSVFKFFLVAFIGFALNESLFALLLYATPLHYTAALIITIFLVAIITFIFSKLWAFK
jgi:putative flippase GtrA